MTERPSQTSARRRRSLPVRGGTAAVLGVVANAVLVVAADSLEVAPGFDALTLPPVAVLSAVGAVGATAVYWALGRYVAAADRLFVRLAVAVLVLSFLPSLALLAVDPAATVAGVVALLVTHVTVAAASVWTVVYWEVDQ